MQVFHISNEYIQCSISSYGATLLRLQYLCKGEWCDSILSYENDADILSDKNCLNAVCGPHAGRIKNGAYTINTQDYQLEVGSRGNNLHSAPFGYHGCYFDVKNQTRDSIVLKYLDRHNNMIVEVEYRIGDATLHVELRAYPTVATLINMTLHTYFNLNQTLSISDMEMQVTSDFVTELDATQAPTRNEIPVHNTVFDFNTSRTLGDVLNRTHSQFEYTKHIDHPYHIVKWPLILKGNQKPYSLSILANCDYAVIYVGTFFETQGRLRNIGKGKPFSGIAIEPQDLPNGINLGDTLQIYNKGDIFRRTIEYSFSTFE